MSTNLTVKPLSKAVGVIVSGIDASRPQDDATRKELRDLYSEYGLLLFRDQQLTPEQHIAFSRIFSELDIHPFEQVRLEGYPEIIELSNRRNPVPPDQQEQVIGKIPWHSDLTYTVKPCRGAVLLARAIPEAGGETGFVDTAAAYDSLSEEMKQRIDRLELQHSNRQIVQSAVKVGRETPQPNAGNSGDDYETKVETDPAAFPDIIHPIVATHPETGRKALNVSPAFARFIVGMAEEESRALLDELIAHATSSRFAYVHSWRLGDMIIWDNWRTLHMATGHKAKYLREMHRTTLSAEYDMGRVAA